MAVNLLPVLMRSARLAWQSLRLRGGLRRRWWQGVRLVLVTVVANTLRRGEEIALAAEARAFVVGRVPLAGPGRGRADVAVAVVLLGALIILRRAG